MGLGEHWGKWMISLPSASSITDGPPGPVHPQGLSFPVGCRRRLAASLQTLPRVPLGGEL